MKKRTIKLNLVITKVSENDMTQSYSSRGILDEQKCIDNALDFLGNHPELFIDKSPKEVFRSVIEDCKEAFMNTSKYILEVEKAGEDFREVVLMYIASRILYDQVPTGDIFLKVDAVKDSKFELIISNEEIESKYSEIFERIEEANEDMGL